MLGEDGADFGFEEFEVGGGDVVGAGGGSGGGEEEEGEEERLHWARGR